MSQRLPSEIFVPPLPSFPVPVAPPEASITQVALCIPDTWLPVVRGALQQLIQPTTWAGTAEEIAAAQTEAATIIAMMTEGCATETVPTPYWDDADDVDDQEPPDEQPWYGKMEGLDFVEEIGIWAITGFIAYSGQIGAAIAFKTFAPRFVLAWKQGGVAAAVEVFIDGISSGELEIGSGTGIVEQDFVGDPELEEHDIRIVYKGAA